MKRRATELTVSDHAVLRYLEREHGLDVEAVRSHLARPALHAAELGAVAVQIERIKLVIRTVEPGRAVVVTALHRSVMATDHGQYGTPSEDGG
tara:strand:- start:23149 stop:23427 length:279 start_codon:yes stop_codon:yes gene_type:complete